MISFILTITLTTFCPCAFCFNLDMIFLSIWVVLLKYLLVYHYLDLQGVHLHIYQMQTVQTILLQDHLYDFSSFCISHTIRVYLIPRLLIFIMSFRFFKLFRLFKFRN